MKERHLFFAFKIVHNDECNPIFLSQLLDAPADDDNFYGGVSGSPAYDTFQNQQPDAVSAEEQAAREQVWRSELAKVSHLKKK